MINWYNNENYEIAINNYKTENSNYIFYKKMPEAHLQTKQNSIVVYQELPQNFWNWTRCFSVQNTNLTE